ncbi:FtsW/RodA/SpoVE family cell cycle protein [Jeotgalibaca porci]|uniref:Probable peptidoglycan glycosyltransferase FtsW n=4 Tax=Jeotgalibaca porci TaxID=1868793 RepID=A0A6G7WFJ8_9LACT|nr:putative peptidoglycan glycosyltransferase FtsW [Jeotgalibaca porci]NLB98909.1 cell division protein FtsW [Lactobacillales bacterium]QIK50989.1 cell division protein FtsW [Jeotgalibaca porci]
MANKKSSLLSGVQRKFRHSDWKLLIPYFILLGIGILMVYSSSSYFAMSQFNNSEYFLIRQFIFSILSVLVILIGSTVTKRLYTSKRFIGISLLVIMLMLLYVLIKGIAVNGASAWIDLGLFSVQPSELLKIMMVLYLATFLSNNEDKFACIQRSKNTNVFKEIFKVGKKPVMVIAIFLFLVLIQPDMGGVIIIGAICVTMLLMSGLPFWMGLSAIAAVLAFYFAFIGLVKWQGGLPLVPAYMMDRFTAFLDPFEDVRNSSFQLVNSFYALARGGLFGVGIGESVQKTGYLPESYTDFIIPIMAEELGLFRVLAVLATFFYMIFRMYRISLSIKDSFGQLVCIGMSTLFLVQGTINVGGAVGILPLTGVTFPFVSYGGSSLIVSSVALAIVNNIYINDRLG